MPFEADLSQWFGSRFLQSEDIAAMRGMVNDYRDTMQNLNEAADSISYVARGIGAKLHGMGITGPYQEIGANSLTDNPANNVFGAPPAVSPAQSTANTLIAMGANVPDFMLSNDPYDPYTVTSDYVDQSTKVTEAVKALPGEAFTYAENAVSKYMHYALWIAIAAGVVIFLPEIKAVTRVLRSATK